MTDLVDCMRNNVKDGDFEKIVFWAYQSGKWGSKDQIGELPQGKKSRSV